MSWEVRTMQSKTSYFNATLFRKNLTRFWPLWGLASFIGALFPLAVLLDMVHRGWNVLSAPDFTGMYYDAVSAVPVINLVYAALCAMAVWSYLYNARSVGLMHTLPIRREGLFLTNFLSGLSMTLIPYAVTGVLCVVVSLCGGAFDAKGLAVTVLAVLGESFFYFSSATFVAFITGNAFTMPQYWETERRGRDRADKPEYKVKITAALCFSRNLSRLEYYHNSSWLEHGGAPDKAARSGFVSAIDAYLKQNGKYAKNESKITFQDVADCLVLVTNCFSTQTSYENQTKKSINNRFIQEAMTEFFRSRLQVYFLENKQEADRIAEQVLINKRSRETAERARITVKKKLSGNLDIANRVQKFVDCRSRDASRRELYIVEGDSAMGSVKLSRDAEFQGIMPIRGKILNCLKADYARIFKSEIITDLLRVMGCGVEVRDKHVKDLTAFDLGSLRWNKIVICTDADYDGFQIRTLVLTMLYRLVPTLIREGYVYIAETPLFEITCKDKTWFAYNETEKADILKQLEGKKISVARSKGLGENEPEMMWLTTMNPETRRLIKVMPEDAEKTAFYFDLLLGDNLAGRKEYIAENGSQYLEMADIS